MRRRTLALSLAASAALIAGAGVVTALPASAAAGCRVAYTVSSQWPGGFGANVTITNLGDPLTNWTLVWSYSGGQTVTQAWNTSLTQSGSQVTARNAGYNGSVGTNATVSFGFNGSGAATPAPGTFTLNGTACTGSAGPTSPSSQPPTNGVPSDAVWVDSGQWANWTNNGYILTTTSGARAPAPRPSGRAAAPTGASSRITRAPAGSSPTPTPERPSTVR
uniref:Endoglucanase n=1 Tax=Actinoplanes garbadinensis TaxID=69485 RepID=C4NFG6_ACTGA|nr:endoglucanase [Actinoplanes garbadinensis]